MIKHPADEKHTTETKHAPGLAVPVASRDTTHEAKHAVTHDAKKEPEAPPPFGEGARLIRKSDGSGWLVREVDFKNGRVRLHGGRIEDPRAEVQLPMWEKLSDYKQEG